MKEKENNQVNISNWPVMMSLEMVVYGSELILLW